jgi:negative regulator of flagellin synthesis FlgM
MKINGGGLEKILGIYKKQGAQPARTEKTSVVKGTSGVDKIELSAEARDFQVALRALNETTDVRQDKVKQLKAKITAGEYNVNAEEVAERIIDSLFFDKKV